MIELIHPVKIYKVHYDGDLEFLKSSVIPKLNDVFEKTKLNNQDSMRNGGLCSYNVVRELHRTIPELSSYISFLKHHLAIYWKELNYDNKKNPFILDVWANTYKTGSFIDMHNHSPIAITGSFYLQKTTNSGNIVFENPLDTVLRHQPVDTSNIDNYGSWFNKEITVNEGDLILFPGYLRHMTTPNLDTTDRIIIGINAVAID